MTGTLHVLPFRFHFQAADRLVFPAVAGNTFRGAFGSILRRLACVPECPGTAACPRRDECAYARLFEPSWTSAPSGFGDPPRPFVLRAAELDGRVVPPGEAFRIDVHLFETRFAAPDWFQRVFDALAAEGIGPGRGRSRLTRVDPIEGGDVELRFEPAEAAPHHITVRFRTPTELKSHGQIARQFDFPTLFTRVRDRISALCSVYGSGPPPVDFAALGRRAKAIRTVRSDLSPQTAERRSSRTRQTHPLGGLTGEVEYEGELGEFVPWLEAARWTGVGRHTVWGNGAIDLGPQVSG